MGKAGLTIIKNPKRIHAVRDNRPKFCIGDKIKRIGDDAKLEVIAIHRNHIQYTEGHYISGIVSEELFVKA